MDNFDADEQGILEEINALEQLPPSPLLNFGSPSQARPQASAMIMALREGYVQHQPAAAGSWDEEFANVLGELLLDRCDAKDATAALEGMAQRRSQLLKQDLSQQVHRPARFMHLQALAAELDAQAATWHLVWCLHCNEMPPAGTGGPEVLDTAGLRTTRQILADHISSDAQLTRCAAVIAWLESMADDALNGSPGANSAHGQPRFAEYEGVWLETKHRLGQGGWVTELDPDAPSRQGRTLHSDNAKAEDRLTYRLWQLVRSGRLKDARALCCACGQPWRAASIGGPGGDFGPLPVGLAAGQVEEDLTEEMQVEDIMHEVATGPSMSRATWKWTCLQAAQRAVKSGARYEAALYGALCAYLPATLAVCGSWEDACWAYCRAWLDVATDAPLSREPGPAAELDSKNLAINGDVLVHVVRSAVTSQGGLAAATALPGTGPADAATATVMSALTVLDGQWPAGVLPQASGGLVPPATFDALFAMLAASGVASVVAAGRDNVHQIQQHLIKDSMAALAQHLYSWLVAKDGTVTTQAAGQTPTATALFPTSALSFNSGGDVLSDNEPLATSEGLSAAGSSGLPSRPARLVAFGCHLLLGLEGLGVLRAGGASREDAVENARISSLAEQVVAMYLSSLLERQLTALVPQYLCHLGEIMRSRLAHETLSVLTDALVTASPITGPPIRGLASGGKATLVLESAADAACYEVYQAMAHWFGHCHTRQLRQQHEQGDGQREGLRGARPENAEDNPSSTVTNSLRTSIRHQETRILLTTFMDHMRFGPAYSPLARVTAARWLFYPHLQLQRDFGGSSATQAAADPYVWSDALELSNALCCELALGGSGAAAAAAHYMLSAVVSPGFEAAASDAVDGMRLQSEGLRAEVAAAQGALESAEMSGDEPGQAEASDAAAAALAAHTDLESAIQQVSELLAELSSWRVFFDLDRRVAEWGEQYEAAQAAEHAPAAALAPQAEHLLDELSGQLLKGGWMAWGGEAPALDSQEAQQQHQHHHLQDAPSCTVDLVLTSKQASHTAIASQALSASEHPFVGLKGAELYELEMQLRSALASVTHASGVVGPGQPSMEEGVQAQVVAPQGAEGFVTVSLTCPLRSAKAWHAMTTLAVSIVQSSLPGLPQVYVVNMRASRPASMAICRRCCLGQAVMHCSALRHARAVLGGDGTAGEELVELLASGPDRSAEGTSSGLACMLSPAMLQCVLQREADTAVQVLWNEQQQRL